MELFKFKQILLPIFIVKVDYKLNDYMGIIFKCCNYGYRYIYLFVQYYFLTFG